MKTDASLETCLTADTLDERLDALRQLCANAPARPRRGVNLHIHTNESFSVFRSPSEAVWQAVQEGVAVFGINDHYTVAGFDEFCRACEIAGLPATFSMEAVAMDRGCELRGVLTNDPGNPGRTYLCAKGITRVPSDDSPAMMTLRVMRAALERRNQAMVEKVSRIFSERLGTPGPTWAEVSALTPRGNVTERHIAKAILLRKCAISSCSSKSHVIEKCCGAKPPSDDDAQLQNFIRAKLLKAGAPCYVEESSEAFISIEEMRDLFLAFGAIPTYPVLGNPETEFERDIDTLMARLESMRIFALEVIPQRNTRVRLAEIISAAQRRHWPVFCGTEHNTPEHAPLLAPLALEHDFLPWFESSAAVLLGHQKLAAQGAPFVDDSGMPMIRDAKERFEFFKLTGDWRQ